MEWENEPNQVDYEIHGYKVQIFRNPYLGNLLGYVFLNKDQPCYGCRESEIDVRVHGGITYAEKYGDYWKIGFDCAHSGDFMPYAGPHNNSSSFTYKNIQYVKDQLTNLVDQLSSYYDDVYLE